MQFVEKNKASVLIDGQWGSTGKGLLAAYLARQECNEVRIATTNASSNAGHTTVMEDGHTFITFHLPTFAVIQPGCVAYLNAGSIIDPSLLEAEMRKLNFPANRLFIHPNATVITDEDKQYEGRADSSNTFISSTQKGVGTALARKIRREAKTAKDHDFLKKFIREIDLNNHTCVVEVPQGFDLSLDHGMGYPYTTSRNITVGHALADAGIHPSRLGKTVMSIRTHPIRVGNIVDADGREMGHSGPHYDDQVEQTWDEIKQAPERTTVTKRVRRVFSFSQIQYRKALKALRPDMVFVNFLNYLPTAEAQQYFMYALSETEMEVGVIPQKIFGCGPRIDQVFDNLPAAQDYLNIAKGDDYDNHNPIR